MKRFLIMGGDLREVCDRFNDKQVYLVFKDGAGWVGYLRGVVPDTSDTVYFERWSTQNSLLKREIREVDCDEVRGLCRQLVLADYL